MLEPFSAWLRLAAVTTIGPAEIDHLLQHFGSATEIVTASEKSLAAAGLTLESIKTLKHEDPSLTRATEKWLSQDGTHLLSWDDPRYPPLLKTVSDAPPVLYVHGNPDVLSLPLLAIVGSRNPTRGGEATAHNFAAEFARCGLNIVSGLALGIDTAAHNGALSANGVTIAVLGTGIDRVYPSQNHALAHRITESGAVVSEFPLGTAPIKYHFPRRNRIISGLALGALVVEAAERSGSLITARLASEQGREVFAIPGSIHNPMSRGCHRLIRDGARLVETTADVFDEIRSLTNSLIPLSAENADPERSHSSLAANNDEDYRVLLDALGWEPLGIEAIVQRSGLTIAEVSSMLLILELEGVVEPLPGGRYARLKQERQHP